MSSFSFFYLYDRGRKGIDSKHRLRTSCSLFFLAVFGVSAIAVIFDEHANRHMKEKCKRRVLESIHLLFIYWQPYFPIIGHLISSVSWYGWPMITGKWVLSWWKRRDPPRFPLSFNLTIKHKIKKETSLID